MRRRIHAIHVWYIYHIYHKDQPSVGKYTIDGSYIWLKCVVNVGIYHTHGSYEGPFLVRLDVTGCIDVPGRGVTQFDLDLLVNDLFILGIS